MGKESAPSVPVSRPIVCSVFGCSFGCFNDAAREDTKELIYMCSSLMCNGAVVCYGSMVLKILVRYHYYMWKYLKSDYGMMFAVPLVLLVFKYTVLMISSQPNHCETVSCSFSLIGSNGAL